MIEMRQRVKVRLAGVAGLLTLVAVVGSTLGVYQKVFVSSVDVTVQSGRAGLLLDRGAKVRVNGMPVGEVRSVELDGEGEVRIALALDPGSAELIPAGIEADITPSTVFGAKYVDLLVPDGVDAAAQPIQGGDTIRAAEVGVEANDVFAQVQDLLTTVDPGQLNSTLTAMSTALEGRGDQLGDYLVRVNRYVGALNGSSDALTADIRLGAEVADLYADVSPQLLDIASQGSVTARTLDEKSATLQALLVDLTAAADRTRGFLGTIESPLVSALDVMRPVLASFEKFSPEFTCLLQALVQHRDKVNTVLGGSEPGIQGLVSLLPASPGYEYPRDLPQLIPNARPSCLSLPALDLAKPPVRRFDDGSPGPDDSEGFDLSRPPAEIYLGLVEEWFGQTGLDLLLDDIATGQSGQEAP